MSPPHDSPPSSMPSPSSRRPSEVVDVEWIEGEGALPPRSPEPPVDLAARARGRAGRRGQGARRSHLQALGRFLELGSSADSLGGLDVHRMLLLGARWALTLRAG